MPRPLRDSLLVLAASLAVGCSGPSGPTQVVYAWTAGADSSAADFLAVVDVDSGSPTYGEVLQRVEVPGRGNRPHHSEHELAGDGRLFVNGFASGQSWVFDVSDRTQPRIVTQFGDMAGYSHPHSFIRLPNGNVLGTFQMQHLNKGMRPGGLVELTPDGAVVRASAPQPSSVTAATRVYSGAVVEALDRIVTTTTDMDGDDPASRQVQVWRLSDLTLLHTITLADGPRGGEGMYTAEPRLLGDGRTVLVSTFACGLYLMQGLESERPSAELVASFPEKDRTNCAIPAVVGDYYLVTVPAYSAVVALDISNPGAPREVSRAVFDSTDVPHWLSVSPDRRRVVVTGYATMQTRVELLSFDPATGALGKQRTIADVGGIPHGAVFSRP
ncbi:hypothetical protein Strain138_002226 [Pseudogemmatithrix spongiicola]|uniref:Lipoprotein n=1 Tax=Pseudogemmatithrix spongiicola TaxID=3062599 RepID=A0AA49Q698_9BACT|nr:hypothetical protein Strain138_002226 [Gemmatimonadaceae bacterium 'strain 138']WKW15822.1 hypothetical protein Strain318_002225 [Gemmatimonadaceae bacterium 'strain 318']